MLRWLNWISKLLVAGILIAGLTLYITWVTVSMYVEKIIAQLPIEGVQQVDLPELVGRLTQGYNLMKSLGSGNGAGNGNGAKGTSASANANAAGSPSPTPAGSEAGSGNSGGTAAQKQPGDDALAVMGRSGSQGSGMTEQRELVMSADQFLRAKDNLTEEDSMTIFSLLIARLSQDELQQLSAMVEDGITEDELGQVERIVENRLQPGEYQKLLDILQKY
ncbi:hypothetical protein [Paenibacillus cymbidii]|uniref:hypothetical protein n=1 Tax=Paenibacillus cymbidii TaxID=1639034 RepID=UPI0010820715|nr:hypothetical protein [Paenibacillus cymbidii]